MVLRKQVVSALAGLGIVVVGSGYYSWHAKQVREAEAALEKVNEQLQEGWKETLKDLADIFGLAAAADPKNPHTVVEAALSKADGIADHIKSPSLGLVASAADTVHKLQQEKYYEAGDALVKLGTQLGKLMAETSKQIEKAGGTVLKESPAAEAVAGYTGPHISDQAIS